MIISKGGLGGLKQVWLGLVSAWMWETISYASLSSMVRDGQDINIIRHIAEIMF